MYVVDEAVTRYLGNLSKSTRKITKSNLRSFFTWMDEEGGEFSGMSPAEQVKWMKDHPGSY